MATKATNRREVDDASLEAFRAVQHVIERTESQGDKQLTDAKGLKQRFDAAHRKGMKAIKRGDLKSFGAAIDEEREIIKQIPNPPNVIKPTRKR